MIKPAAFANRTPDQIREELRGFPGSVVEAALRFHDDGRAESLFAMLPGMIEYYLPRGAAKPAEPLSDELRLTQDLGLDSLSLLEMAFKFDELLGVNIESTEVKGTTTAGELKALILRKLSPDSA